MIILLFQLLDTSFRKHIRPPNSSAARYILFRSNTSAGRCIHYWRTTPAAFSTAWRSAMDAYASSNSRLPQRFGISCSNRSITYPSASRIVWR